MVFRLIMMMLAALPAFAPQGTLAAPALILATTTSTQDTGLLDVLVPAFEKASGYSVKTVAVGTGAALAMGERGDADVLLVHAPSAEAAYMAKGRGISRALVMHDAFIVVGPAADPAHVKGAATAQAAFAAISGVQAPFVSRGDDSGTNVKELALWRAASVEPGGSWYVKTGGGMAEALRVASQKGAYTLTDDGTYLTQRATLSLVPLVEDAKDLLNVYHVIVVRPLPGQLANEAGAEAFARYVTSPEGQRLIGEFGRERFGRPLFTPDAGKGTELIGIAALSVAVSGIATVVAGVLAVPGALWIVYGRSNLRAVLLAVYGAGLGLPPVAVGLAVAFVFWRSGPLGFVDWLYTPGAMCLAQTIIVLPLIGTLAVVALRGGDATLALQLSALGIPRRMRLVLLAREVAPGLAAAMLAGFGRAIAEVGAAQMTGGNIEGQTRVLTTATMLAVGRGQFAEAFAHVAVLLGIAAVATGAALALQRRWA